jgi:hypothetical protein
MTWDVVATMGRVLIFCVLLTPVAILLGIAAWRVYRFWRVWQADEATLRRLRLHRIEPDQHGFVGHVADLGSGAFRDLDTGEQYMLVPRERNPLPERMAIVGKQRWLAALFGANLHKAVSQVIDPKQEPTKQVIELGAGPWLRMEEESSADGDLVV